MSDFNRIPLRRKIFFQERYGLLDGKPKTYDQIAKEYERPKEQISVSVRSVLMWLIKNKMVSKIEHPLVKKHCKLLKKNKSARLLLE